MAYVLKFLSLITGFFAFTFLILFLGFIFTSSPKEDISSIALGLVLNMLLFLGFSISTYCLWMVRSPKYLFEILLRSKKLVRKASVANDDIKTETLTSRRITFLYKLATQILADNEVDFKEAKKLLAWLQRYPESKDDYRTQNLYMISERALEDGVLDSDEALELFAELSEYCDQYESVNAKEIEFPVSKNTRNSILQNAIDKKIAEYDGLAFVEKLEAGREYFMEYLDSKGKISERGFIFRTLDLNQGGNPYIKGICTLRRASRTFRADKIQTLCDVETGEVLV